MGYNKTNQTQSNKKNNVDQERPERPGTPSPTTGFLLNNFGEMTDLSGKIVPPQKNSCDHGLFNEEKFKSLIKKEFERSKKEENSKIKTNCGSPIKKMPKGLNICFKLVKNEETLNDDILVKAMGDLKI